MAISLILVAVCGAMADNKEASPATDAPRLYEKAQVLSKVPVLDLAGRVKDQTRIPDARTGEEESKAYCLAILFAHTTSARAFAGQARHDLSYAHLFEEPEKYRGQVVHVEGRLKRLRRFEADPEIRGTYEIPYVYEGWIFDVDHYGANPTCLLFTDLPAGIEVGESLDQRVALDGYFFKKYRYKGGDGWHDCPLLIGHSPSLLERHAAPATGLSHLILGSLLFVLALTVGLAVGLGWWYRQGDKRVRSMLAASRPAVLVEESNAAFAEPGTAIDATRPCETGNMPT